MLFIRIFILMALVCMAPSSGLALKGVLATEEEIRMLKEDLQNGVLTIGKTRLEEIRQLYGDPSAITDTEKKVSFDYGELSIDFSKDRVWIDWSYDTFKDPVYTDDVDDLRFDLESQELIGESITYADIRKDYGQPTESSASTEDGEISVYYFGDIKMVFENQFVVRSWRGENLGRMAEFVDSFEGK